MVQGLRILFVPFLLLLLACTETSTDSEAARGGIMSFDSMDGDTTRLSMATFAGGCFWCTEAYFERLEGVRRVVAGYAGGLEENPTYQDVSAGRTGHAKCVQVYFNPDIISYRELLEIFFATHDPTTLNRQGPDIGKQYRSVIFYHNQEQQRQAQQYIRELHEAGVYPSSIVTKVEPLPRFWVAEGYHQDYYNRNPEDAYIQRIARPKVEKFEAAFRNKLKNMP